MISVLNVFKNLHFTGDLKQKCLGNIWTRYTSIFNSCHQQRLATCG